MCKNIEDKVFGKMKYEFGWIKKEKISLWENVYEITVKAASYDESEITEKQQKAYIDFKNSLEEISEKSLDLLKKYIYDVYERKIENNEILELINPKTVLIKKNGDYGILLDTELDVENGLVVIVSPEYEVGVQDIFI